MNGLDVIGPQLAVLVAAGVLVIIDALVPSQRKMLPYIALVGVLVSVAWSVSWLARDEYQTAFGGTISLDQYSLFFYFIFAGITGTVILASIDWVEREGRGASEYYSLILVVCSGLMFLSASRDLITIFISLELSSIPQYVLAGWGKNEKSSEAGLKYLLIGAVASSILLYGMAMLFGVTGSTMLPEIGAAIADNGLENRSVLVLAMVLVIAGFGFKMAIVPFQMWVPDVYQGAPTPVAAFLSVGSKGAAFAVIIRVLFEAFPEGFLRDDWTMIFAIIAAVSMTLGNVMAVVQTDIKRMLGYSSVAQAGTFLIGLAAISTASDEFTLGASGVLFFVAAYAFTNLGAFIGVIAISQKIGSDQIKDYAGIWKRAPVLTLAMAFCLISLTGIPPTVGFWAKLYVFNAGIHADLGWLVIIGVLNTMISAFYYMGVVRQMFLGEPKETEPIRTAAPISIAMGFATLGVVVFGILPEPLISAARDAADIFARQ